MNVNGVNSQVSQVCHLIKENESEDDIIHSPLTFELRGKRKAIFDRLYEKKIIDENGLLKKKSERLLAPLISTAKIREYLNNPIVEGEETRIIDFLQKITQIKMIGTVSFRLIGGFLRWIILQDISYFKEALKPICDLDDLIDEEILPKNPTIPQDLDLQVLVTECTDRDFSFLVRDILKLTKSKLNIKKKKKSHFDGENHYGVLTLGIPNAPDLELLLVKKLKRSSIFIHEDLRVDLTDTIKNQSTSNVAIESEFSLQPLIDQLTGLIHTDKVTEIDHNGWPKFIGEITKGKNCWEKNTELTLKNTAMFYGGEESLLIKNLKNHYSNKPEFSLAYLFNASVSMDRIIERDTMNKIKELKKGTLAHAIQRLLRQKNIHFKTILAYLTVISVIRLTVTQGDAHPITLIKSGDKRFIRVENLLIPHNFKEAIEHILVKGNAHDFQSIYKLLMKESDLQTKIEPVINQENIFNEADKLLKSNNWKPLGFKILCLDQTLNEKASHIETLCSIFPVCGSLSWFQFAIRHSIFAPLENELTSKKLWILQLAGTQDKKLCSVALTLWENKHENSHEFCQKLLPAAPEYALKVFKQLEDINLFLKILRSMKIRNFEVEDAADRMIKKCVSKKQFSELFKLLKGINSSSIISSKNIIQVVSQLDSKTITRCVTDPSSPFQHNPQILIKSLEAIDSTTIKNNLDDKYRLLQVAIKSAVRKDSKEVVQHLIRILALLSNKNLSLTKHIKKQLKASHEHIISYLKEQILSTELHLFANLLFDLNLIKSLSERFCQNYLWSLSSEKQLSNKTLTYLKKHSQFKNLQDNQELQKVLICHVQSLTNNHRKAAFLIHELPKIYGEADKRVFSKCVTNVIIEFESKKIALQLLIQFKISDGNAWVHTLKKVSSSKNKKIKNLAWQTLIKGVDNTSANFHRELWELGVNILISLNDSEFFESIEYFLSKNESLKDSLSHTFKLEFTKLYYNCLTRFEKIDEPESLIPLIVNFRYQMSILHEIRDSTLSTHIDLPFFNAFINSKHHAPILWVMKDFNTLKKSDFLVLLPTVISLLKAYQTHSELHDTITERHRMDEIESSETIKNRYEIANNLFINLSEALMHFIKSDSTESFQGAPLISLIISIFLDYGCVETIKLPYILLKQPNMEKILGRCAFKGLWTKYMQKRLEKSFYTVKDMAVDSLHFFLDNERELSDKPLDNELCYKWVLIHLAKVFSKHENLISLTNQVKKQLLTYAKSIDKIDEYKILFASYLIKCDQQSPESAEIICSQVVQLLTEVLESSPKSNYETFSFVVQFLIAGHLCSDEIQNVFLKFSKNFIKDIQSKQYFGENSGLYLIALMQLNMLNPTDYFDVDFVKDNMSKSIVYLMITLLQSDIKSNLPLTLYLLEKYQFQILQNEPKHLLSTYQHIFNKALNTPEFLKIAPNFLISMYNAVNKLFVASQKINDSNQDKNVLTIFQLWQTNFIQIILTLIKIPHSPYTLESKPEQPFSVFPGNTHFILDFFSESQTFDLDPTTSYELFKKATPYIISVLKKLTPLHCDQLVSAFTQLIIDRKSQIIQPPQNLYYKNQSEIISRNKHLIKYHAEEREKSCLMWIKALSHGGFKKRAEVMLLTIIEVGYLSKNLNLASIINPSNSKSKRKNRRRNKRR